VERVVNLPLSEEEASALQSSGGVLRGVLDELDL
jgi:hypothetical protein